MMLQQHLLSKWSSRNPGDTSWPWSFEDFCKRLMSKSPKNRAKVALWIQSVQRRSKISCGFEGFVVTAQFFVISRSRVQIPSPAP